MKNQNKRYSTQNICTETKDTNVKCIKAIYVANAISYAGYRIHIADSDGKPLCRSVRYNGEVSPSKQFFCKWVEVDKPPTCNICCKRSNRVGGES